MKKIVEDVRLIYKCCSLYYEEQMTQQQICNHLGISRVSVSRMLGRGREIGIVNIELHNPTSLTYSDLERELEKKYHLKDVSVVENSPLDTKYEKISGISKATINYLEHHLKPGKPVGVSMGMTLHNVAMGIRNNQENIGCTFIPVVGGISQGQPDIADIHSNQIAKEFARLFGGDYLQFFSPAVFSDKSVMKGFLNEASMKVIFQAYEEMETVIMGIGIPERGGSTLLTAGYIDEQKLEAFVNNGAVGDISLQFFDQSGSTEKFSEFNDRVSGMPIHQLKQIETRLGIATESVRAKAVMGAIKGGFVNSLIIDYDCAQELLKL